MIIYRFPNIQLLPSLLRLLLAPVLGLEIFLWWGKSNLWWNEEINDSTCHTLFII